MPESPWVRYIAAVIDDAVVIFLRDNWWTTMAPEELRRRLAVRLFRELREEGRLTPDA